MVACAATMANTEIDALRRRMSEYSTGLCIFAKRLEQGRFASLWRDDGKVVRLTASELALFVEGCDLVGRRALSPAALVPKKLVSERTM